jgi:hypothetical protein
MFVATASDWTTSLKGVAARFRLIGGEVAAGTDAGRSSWPAKHPFKTWW